MDTSRRLNHFSRSALISIVILTIGFVSTTRSSLAAEQFTATASSDAPGMIHLSWPIADGTNGNRITWWTGSDTQASPTGQAIRWVGWPRPDTASMTLTGLSAGSYQIAVEATNDSGPPEGLDWTAVDEIETVTVTAALNPATACPTTTTVFSVTVPVAFCVDITNIDDWSGLDLQLEWISNESGGTLASDPDTDGRMLAVVEPAFPRPRADASLDQVEPYGVEPWYRARLSIVEFTGQVTSRWWTQPGFRTLDSGETFRDATDFLIPDTDSNGGTPPTFEIELDDTGVLLSGTIEKEDGDGSAALDPTSYYRGGDIASPCVEIFSGTGDDLSWVISMCANGGTPDDPRDGGFGTRGNQTGPGDWAVRLPEASYRLRINDRTSFEIDSGELEMQVRFAAEWYVDGATRAENREQATVIDTTDGVDRTDLDVVLRDAKQLGVRVTDVPEGFRDGARVVVTDEFGNWFGGAAVLDADAGTWTTRFTGLVEGRRYKVFLYFNGSEGYRWWLVGGGTLELADGIIPTGDTLVEPWQPMPYAVAVTDQFGTPWDDGRACFSLVVSGETADEVLASSCTTTVNDIPGVIVLQRVIAGDYDVIGWVTDADTGEVVGEPISLGTVSVDADQTEGPITSHASGIADVSQLADGVEFMGRYDESWVVVIPDPDAQPPSADDSGDEGTARSYVVSMHESDGTPLQDDEGCIVVTEGDEEIASGCTATVSGIAGLVFIDDVPAGVWEVTPIRLVDGRPTPVGISLTVDTADWADAGLGTGYGIGIADVTNLDDGVTLTPPYFAVAAVVMPAGDE